MTDREMGIEEARKSLGDLVLDAQRDGIATRITRKGKPAAILMPDAEAEARFTADKADPSWLPRVLHVLARDYPEINDKVWSTAIGENASEQVAKRKPAETGGTDG